MKCPKCGSPKAKYDVSRRKHWKKNNQGTKAPEPREDFNASCSKCGWKGEIKPVLFKSFGEGLLEAE